MGRPGVIVCLVGAVFVLSVGPRPGGALHVLLGLGRWPISIFLVSLAVGLIVRYGPAERAPRTSRPRPAA
jgi:hypothetical protein